MEYTNRQLLRYDDGRFLRMATLEEAQASCGDLNEDLEPKDIEVEINGETVTCYVAYSED